MYFRRQYRHRTRVRTIYEGQSRMSKHSMAKRIACWALRAGGGTLPRNTADAHLYRLGESFLPSESVDDADGRLAGDRVQFHRWHFAICSSEIGILIEQTSIFSPECPLL